jgi:hypothetical protein
VLAEHMTTNRQRLLSEGIGLLAGSVAGLATPAATGGPAYARSWLLHTTFLAQAYLRHGDLAEAISAMRTGVGLLPFVQSPRGRNYLRQLRPALARRSRSPLVAEFLPQFDEALSTA